MLAAWAASPARLREDANAEEDYARTAYRDRLVVELAQNAADAAGRAGVPGRLLLRRVGGVLYAANAGAPLDAAGVEALCHLRVSPKGESDVGRYGAGFKAVIAVTDQPAIVSRGGGVCWSAARTRELAPGAHVPAMRLPFPYDADPVAAGLLEEWDTVVVLPLRTDVELSFEPELLLFLPGLAEVDVEGRLVTLDPDAWVVRRASGVLDPALLADRPREERERPGWSLTWAVRLGPDGVPVPLAGPQRLYAPQPTDEPLDLPALLSLSVPLDSGRRHVVTGPLTGWLVARAAEEYAALLASLPGTPALGALVPRGFPAGAVDMALREALPAALERSRFLASAADPEHRLRPGEAAQLDCGDASRPLTALLAPLLPALVDPAWPGGLGVRTLDTADLVELLHSLDRPPSWWRELYGALVGVPDRDALRALPVPLADGRMVTGPRDLLLPGDVTADVPLRVVHPDAAHELLRSLGARDLDAATLLDELREAVENSLDDEQPDLAGLVLGVVTPALAVERPWLAELALPSADGELRAAGELLLPGGPMAAMVDPESPFGIVADGAGDDAALEAVGVLRTLAVVRDADVVADPDLTDHWLDGEADWLAYAGPGVIAEMAAVRDLEWVRDWRLAWDELPDVVTEPVTVLRPDGGVARAPSYTAWWLRRHACVPTTDGRLVRPVAAAVEADELRAATALSGRAAALAVALGADDLAEWLLDVLPDSTLGPAALRRAYASIGGDVEPPDRVRAVRDGEAVTVAAEEAVVVDAPDLLPFLAGWAVVPGPAALADLLDLDRASEVVDAAVTSSPVAERPWPEGVTELLGPLPPYAEHDPLVAGGVRVPWRVVAGRAHVDRSAGKPDLSRAAAWLAGRWERRDTVAAHLAADPTTRAALAAEAFLD